MESKLQKFEVLNALKLDSKTLKKRITDGIYPRPHKRGSLTCYSQGWLMIALSREHEYRELNRLLEVTDQHHARANPRY